MTFLRRPEPWVFVILLASYSYVWHGRDWNVASRLMLTYALVDRGTLSIDGLDDQTRDIARYRGHYFSDKTPGFSLLATAPYYLAKRSLKLPDHPLNRPGFAHWPADYWATLGTSGLLTALSGLILVILARDLGCTPGRSAIVGLAYGLATPAQVYATLGYGHQASSFCLLASFALLWRGGGRPILRACLAGFLASYASVIEIQVGPVSAILGFYALALAIGGRQPWPSVLAFGLGAAIPAGILLGYNTLAFGSPWRMGYFYEVLDQFSKVHNESNPLGLGRPDWSKLGELLWGERRGLIRFAPIVVLTLPGLLVAAYRRTWGLFVVSASAIGAVLLMNLSYPEWTGGWSTGPRLLLPLLPFAMLPVASLLAVGGSPTAAIAVILGLVGGVEMVMFQAIGARVPQDIARPLGDGVWPLIRGDRRLPGWVFGNRYARNLMSLARPTMAKELPNWAGWVQFLPLLVFQGAMIGLMARVIAPNVLKTSGAVPEPRTGLVSNRSEADPQRVEDS
ncbi:hypothetical protein P12x_004485 [Tundrisphaera lichenicola]|uniref:hypothetical protein n=1 Tax=Tundrisphaera lichenicola TaxID=2029860 RepID=UPI003EB8944B